MGVTSCRRITITGTLHPHALRIAVFDIDYRDGPEPRLDGDCREIDHSWPDRPSRARFGELE